MKNKYKNINNHKNLKREKIEVFYRSNQQTGNNERDICALVWVR